MRTSPHWLKTVIRTVFLLYCISRTQSGEEEMDVNLVLKLIQAPFSSVILYSSSDIFTFQKNKNT